MSFDTQTGGHAVYGAAVGILMLEAQFPRIVGDMGNAMTWPFPVHYKVVQGATPDIVVRQDPRVLLPNFLAAAQELVLMGVSGITTNCGFLAVLQQDFQAALDIPVAASSLMQVSMVQKLLPAGKRVGIITINAQTLSPQHLQAAGAALDTPIMGTDPEGEFSRKILNNNLQMDFAKARLELLATAQAMTATYPEVGAIVLECTNMMPYAAEMQQVSGLPIFGMDSFVRWFHSGLMPPRYP